MALITAFTALTTSAGTITSDTTTYTVMVEAAFTVAAVSMVEAEAFTVAAAATEVTANCNSFDAPLYFPFGPANPSSLKGC